MRRCRSSISTAARCRRMCSLEQIASGGSIGANQGRAPHNFRASSCPRASRNVPAGKRAMAKRQLRLGAFMRPVSIHTGAWRYPGAWPDANFNFAHRGGAPETRGRKFDAFFMADHLAVLNMPINALKRSHTVTSFEPFTLLSALAGGHRTYRVDRDRLDHLRRTLSCRPPFRLAR